MLYLLHSPKFRKQYSVLSEKIKQRVLERLSVFVLDEFDRILGNHQLHGEYAGCRSINITGDIRLIYEKVEANKYFLLAVGTHNQLYE